MSARAHGPRSAGSAAREPRRAAVARAAVARATVVRPGGDVLWFLGTVVKLKLAGEQTGGRLALWEGVLPRGAAPPLHSHPQDETFYILDGEITAWLVGTDALGGERRAANGDGPDRGPGGDSGSATDSGPATDRTPGTDSGPPGWVETHGQHCGVGTVVFAPGGTPHTFRVESDTARMLVISTPAGIEDMVRPLAERADWPWLQPPPDGPRAPAERVAEVERATGMVRHGPPPPPLPR